MRTKFVKSACLLLAVGLLVSFTSAITVAEDVGGKKELSEAIGFLSHDLDKAHHMSLSVKKAIAFAEVAYELKVLGLDDQAKSVFNQSIKVAEVLKKNSDRSSALTAIAVEYRRVGQYEKAEGLLSKSLSEALEIENSFDRAAVYTAVAKEFGKLGKRNEAMSLLEQAESLN